MGEALAAALAIGAAQLVDLGAVRRLPATDLVLASALVLVVAGVVGCAWARVAIMRWGYRRDAERKRAFPG